jgi:DNA-binding response OmpR family regulator
MSNLSGRPPAAACRTLIVEDDRLSSTALRALLADRGHPVSCAFTIGQAMEQLVSFQPQCVVLDLMLPDGSGVQVLRHIREHKLNIRVAVASAGNDERALKEVHDLRADLVMRKPIDLNRLTAWLATARQDDVTKDDAVATPTPD